MTNGPCAAILILVVSDHVEHAGIDHKLLPGCMRELVEFINAEDGINELLKAAMVHFYVDIQRLVPFFTANMQGL